LAARPAGTPSLCGLRAVANRFEIVGPFGPVANPAGGTTFILPSGGHIILRAARATTPLPPTFRAR
jgi:hypothetical protein